MSDAASLPWAPPLDEIILAALFASERPLSRDELAEMFDLGEGAAPPSPADMEAALAAARERLAGLPLELRQLASGYRIEVPPTWARWVSRLWVERPARYSRALLETLALIAYRQPITRPEIEAVRGVVVSTQIVRTLEERNWIRVVGHRDAPGRPALYGTTRAFLDYFGLQSLDELPMLADLRDLAEFEPELPWADGPDAVESSESAPNEANAEPQSLPEEANEGEEKPRGILHGPWPDGDSDDAGER